MSGKEEEGREKKYWNGILWMIIQGVAQPFARGVNHGSEQAFD